MRMTVLNAAAPDQINPAIICPNCRDSVQLLSLGSPSSFTGPQGNFTIGHFKCPNLKCLQFVILISQGGENIYSFPLSKIEFNSQDVPLKVVSHLEEALTCRANNCYIAAAIMLRKTLETLCDELGIEGRTLNDRVKQFSTRVIMSPALLSGLEYIRLLGNDAAHIESKTFADISPNELDVTIEVIKEVLKALYQHQSLINKLQALKKPPTP